MATKNIQGTLNVTDDIQLNGTSIIGGGGTQLYLHTISGLTGWNNQNYTWLDENTVITIVSTSATPLTQNDVESSECACFIPSAINLQVNVGPGNILGSWGNTSSYCFYGVKGGNSIFSIQCSAGDFTDTVTEL